MEKVIDTSACSDPKILAAAQALKNVGLGEWTDVYYEDVEEGGKFFKLSKPYQKQDYDEPDEVSLVFYVDDDYGVGAFHGCEFFDDPDEAAALLKELWDGTICEVTVVVNKVSLTAFLKNLGNAEHNLAPLASDAAALM